MVYFKRLNLLFRLKK